MSKRFLSILLLALTILLAGCAGRGKVDEISTASGEGEIIPSLVGEDWQDNSLDPYSADFIRPLKYAEPEGALHGGAEQFFLGKDRAFAFKKHLFEETGNSWDELKALTEKGSEQSFRLNFWADRTNQAWVVGSFFGNNHCMMMDVEADEEENIRYRFFETDENLHVLRQFYVEGFAQKEYEFPSQILVDVDGNVHVTTYRNSDDTKRYYVITSNETTATELYQKKTNEREIKLFYLYDGRVGLYVDKQLLSVDAKARRTQVITELKQEYKACVLWDERTLLYADDEGLHRSNLSEGEAEMIYLWKNHGIRCSKVLDLRLSENREIALLYMAGGGVEYVKLRPTTEEVQVIKIEFATSASSSQKYQAAAMAFNKAYPAWHVDVKEYKRNDTALLTKLIAGDGPQLVDSFLVEFGEHKTLWEPMEEFYNQVDFEFIPEALEFGRIDGTLYGVVTDFCINTMVTMVDTPEQWDYETFLDCLTKDKYAKKSIYNPINGSDGFPFASLFFHGLDETFLYDADNCITQFDGKDFSKILRLAKNYDIKENQSDLDLFLKGESLCAVVEIRCPEDLATLRIVGQDQLRYVGFPSQTGSVHYLVGSDPLCIRANAAEEEKQAARAFLRYLLSDETINLVDAMNIQWSVRKDLLKKRLELMDESSDSSLVGFPQVSFKDNLDPKKDLETLEELLRNAKPKRYAPKELRIILMEEVSDYLEGNISEADLNKHLKDRVELYLKEQK